jgi:hypothetical protein
MPALMHGSMCGLGACATLLHLTVARMQAVGGERLRKPTIEANDEDESLIKETLRA